MLKIPLGSAFTGLIYFLMLFNVTTAQVVINEICPSNVSVICNSAGNYDDWIELYNTGSSSVNIEGYKLTDDISDPDKFIFPSLVLSPSARVIVFASDETHVPVNHYEMPVGSNALFAYSPGSASLDTNWRNLSFNDQAWPRGYGGIGFNDGDDATIISPTVSVMMRRTFTIVDTSVLLSAVFMMDYDDGFVAYINGIEIARANMPSGNERPEWNTLALSSHEAQMNLGLSADSFYISDEFLKSIIKPGTNVFAVETHDYSSSPTDMTSRPFLFFGIKTNTSYYPSPPSWFVTSRDYMQTNFKLQSSGETIYLVDQAGTVIDQRHYSQISMDHSQGRIPDGSSNWCLMNTPSPGYLNNSNQCYSGYAGSVIISPDGGYFPSTQTVTISSTNGGVVRYTLNGDEPKPSSPVYTGPITISSTKTIRACNFANDLLPGPIVTKTFFINESSKLPVISLTTDSLNLWDYHTGIYVLGPNAETVSPYFGANFWQPWTKPVSVEIFDKTQQRILSFEAEFEIYGNYSRQKPQKSLEVKLKDYYGFGEINYPLISDKPFIKKYDRFVLRNAGTDCNVVHFRDALMQRLVRNTHIDYVAAEPVKVFLNGQQWGVYLLNEKHNPNWVETNYGFDKDDIDLLEESGAKIVARTGSNVSFLELYNCAITSNPADSGYLEEISTRLDIKNFVDYFVAETYYNNGDWIGEWTNNIKIWKSNEQHSRFRYILVDTDYGFGLKGNLTDNRLKMARDPDAFSFSSEIFNALLDNNEFRNYFINRYADLINTIYQPSNVEKVMKQFRDSMILDMVDHFEKWGEDTGSWNNRIVSMMSFVSQRPQIARDHIQSEFNLSGQVLLTVDVFPPGAGRVQISTVVPDNLPWSGVYFKGNPVTVTAIPNPGFTFDHWSSDVVISSDYRKSATYDYSTNDQIIAHFSGSSSPALLTVSEINYHASEHYDAGEWIELYNYGSFDLDISGWSIGDAEDHTRFVFPVSTVIPSGEYLVLTGDSIDFNRLYPRVSNRIGQFEFNLSNSGESIIIQDYSGNEFLNFHYSDDSPWPGEADGDGYTCELNSPSGNLNDGQNWFAGCFGGSPGKPFSHDLATLVDVMGSPAFCEGGTASLTTFAFTEYQYQWAYEGVDLGGQTFDSLHATQEGTYNLLVTCKGCTATSPDFELGKLNNSEPPLVAHVERCRPGAVMLNASSPEVVYWYDSPDGKKIGQGSGYVSGFIPNDTIFYARAGKDCPSDHVALKVTITNEECNALAVYPNPSSGEAVYFHNEELEAGKATLIISDMNGSIVYNRELIISPVGSSGKLPISFGNGIYNFTVYQNDKIFNSKFVLVR